MHPVQHFKANFSQQSQEKLTVAPHGGVSPVGVQLHDADSLVRNICFVWEDGRRAFFNYAYLMASEFEPINAKNLIHLHFSSHTVMLHGYSLKCLFKALLDHLPKVITVTDPRYALKEELNTPVIVAIQVDSKKE